MAFFPANFMLQPPNDQTHHQQQHFHHVQGVAPILGKRSMSFSGMEACQEEEDNLSDIDGSQQLAGDQKKRRLNMEQVKTLERNFEVGNKLDPDRKMQLARALGLQPRQVAIWFQNRRARWKTKQLERDFNLLKKQLDSLKSDNQSLLAYNQKLQAEVLTLKGGGEARESINLNKETDQGSSSNRSESSSEIKLNISTRTPTTTIENESPFCAHQQPTISSRVFFPSSSSMINNSRSSFGQLFQNPQTSRIDLHSHRFDQPVKEETFNMFCAVGQDHSGFWPWIDQQNFH